VVLDHFLDHSDFGKKVKAGTKMKEPAMREKVAPTEKETPPLWTQVLDGIYKNRDSGMLYERPILPNGIRTWRSLKTKNQKHAQEELHRRRANGNVALSQMTVGEVITRYEADGYLDRDLAKRPPKTEADERRHSQTLRLFWGGIKVAAVIDITCDNYALWRKSPKRLKQGTGDRITDRELNTLNNAFRYAKRRGLIRLNPLANRPKYQPRNAVHHCREFMPGDAEQLHACAALLFGHPHSAVLGFQMLFEAYTGLRTCEVLKWRTDSGADGFGYVMGQFLRVWRCKNQHLVNPYVNVHDGMVELLAAHKAWKEDHYPKSPWFFPSHFGGDCVNKSALAHALRRLHRNGGKKFTSHAMRAFYVTVRRSQGATDALIAHEIGHQSGGATLAGTYGGVPPNWLNGGGPNLEWLPASERAWSVLNNQAESAATKAGSLPTGNPSA
jgi:integrase